MCLRLRDEWRVCPGRRAQGHRRLVPGRHLTCLLVWDLALQVWGKEMSNRWSKFIGLALAAAGCGACSGAVPLQATPDYSRFSHSWTTPKVTLYWDCTEAESGAVRIDGVGVNLWEPIPPEFLDLRLFGLDVQGRVLSRTQGSAQGAELIKNFPTPFRLELREQGGEVRVDLAYRYQYRDDSLDGPFRWMPTYITGQVPDACGQGGRQPR